MEHYDDVQQFVIKTGAQNFNYRSFEADAFVPGSSRWKLINQVACFDKNTAMFTRDTYSGSAFSRGSEKMVRSEMDLQRQTAIRHEDAMTSSVHRNGGVQDLSHLFMKTPSSGQAPEKAAASPLSALLDRIGA